MGLTSYMPVANDIQPLQHFEGDWIHWFWKPGNPNRGHLRVQSVFLSEQLNEAYGLYSVHYNEEPLIASDELTNHLTETFQTLNLEEFWASGFEAMPSDIRAVLENRVPSEEWRTSALPTELRTFLSGERQSIVITHTSSGAAAPAPVTSYGALEEQHRASHPALGSVSSRKYSGPLFVYKVNSNRSGSERHKLIEPQSPVNLSWRNDIGFLPNNRTTPTNISYQMQEPQNPPNWDTKRNYFQKLLHVILRDQDGYRLSSHDDDAAKPEGTPFKQWHSRLFYVPKEMDLEYQVIGQAHRDPVLHGHPSRAISKNTPIKINTDWKLGESRRQVRDDWSKWGFGSTSVDIDNDTLPNGNRRNSSEGKLTMIHR